MIYFGEVVDTLEQVDENSLSAEDKEILYRETIKAIANIVVLIEDDNDLDEDALITETDIINDIISNKFGRELWLVISDVAEAIEEALDIIEDLEHSQELARQNLLH